MPEKKAFERPEITTYRRDELVGETVYTFPLLNSRLD